MYLEPVETQYDPDGNKIKESEKVILKTSGDR